MIDMKKITLLVFLIILSLKSYSSSNYHFYLEKKYESSSQLFRVLGNQGFNSVDSFFLWCCDCITYYAKVTGLTYEQLNIILFVIGQPLLIILFMILYIYERRKRKLLLIKH